MPQAYGDRYQISPYAWASVAIAAFLMAAAAIGIVVWRSVNKRLIERTGENLVVSADGLRDSLNRLLFEHALQAQVIAKAPVLRGQDFQQMTRYLRGLQQTCPSYMRLSITNADGRVIAPTDGSGLGSDERESAWFQSLRQGGGLQVKETAVGGLSVLIAAPVENEEGTFVGAVMMRIGLQSFALVLQEALRSSRLLRQSGATPEYRLLSSDGTLLFDSSLRDIGHTNLKHAGLPSAVLSTSGRSGYVEETDFRRRVPVITGYAHANGYGKFPELQWAITVGMDRTDVVASIHRDLKQVVFWGGIGYAILAVLLFWMVARLIRAWLTVKENEALFSTILRSMTGAVIATDTHGRVAFLNLAAERLTGWKDKEARGQALATVYTVAEESTDRTENALGTPGPRGRRLLVARNRTEKLSTYSVSSMRAAEGKVLGSVIVCADDRPSDSRQMSLTDSQPEEGGAHDEKRGVSPRAEDPGLWEVLRHWTRIAEVNRVCLFETHPGKDGTLWASRRYEWLGQAAVAKTEWSQWFNWSMRAKGFSRWEHMLGAGQVIAGRVEDFPCAEQTALSSCGIHTLVVAPIFIGRSWWGFIEFDHCLNKREWTASEVDGLTTAARLFCALLQSAQPGEGLQQILAVLETTLESTADGQLVVDDEGHLVSLNQRLLSMWQMPDAVVESRTVDHILAWMRERLTAPDALLRTISELDSHPDADSYDILELKDGRRIERFSRPKREGPQFIGRVWSFHEVTKSWAPGAGGNQQSLQDQGNVR